MDMRKVQVASFFIFTWFPPLFPFVFACNICVHVCEQRPGEDALLILSWNSELGS